MKEKMVDFAGRFKSPFKEFRKQTSTTSSRSTTNSSNVMTSFQRGLCSYMDAFYPDDEGLHGDDLKPYIAYTTGFNNVSICEIRDECNGGMNLYVYKKRPAEGVDARGTIFMYEEMSKIEKNGSSENARYIGMFPIIFDLLREDVEFNSGFEGIFQQYNMLEEKAENEKKPIAECMDDVWKENTWSLIALCSDVFYQMDKNGELDGIEFKKISKREMERVINENFDHTPDSITAFSFSHMGTRIPEDLKIEGKYQIDPDRVLTEEELALIKANPLKDEYIVDEIDIEVCEDILASMDSASPFDCFIFEGEPGSGKSSKALSIAHALWRPLVIVSCHPTMEFYDLISQVIPPTEDELTKEGKLLIEKINQLGGMTYKNIAEVLELPSIDDVGFAPEDVYEFFGGEDLGRKPNMVDALKLWNERIAEAWNDSLAKISAGAKQNNLKFAETPFLKAVRNGWVVEIQEPTLVINEGVLAGLNSLLQEKTITLPTGEVVKRHRENIIIFTTNVDLEGCRNMNQALMDRAAEVFHINSPSVEVMAQRASAMSGNKDIVMIKEMAKVVTDINKKMHELGVSDGVCGMRSLINWAIKAKRIDPVDAAESTIISKVSLSDEEAKDLAKTILMESKFYENYSMSAA